MEIKRKTKIAYLIFILSGFLGLQGCFIAHVGNRPRWGNTNEFNAIVDKENLSTERPEIFISVDIDHPFLVLPFLFLDVDRNKYFMTFQIRTFNNNYHELDSITYIIKDSTGIQVKHGVVIPKKSSIDKENNGFKFQVNAETDLNLQFDKKLRQDLIIDLQSYFKNSERKQIIESYKYNLRVYNPKWFMTRSFL